MNIIQKNEIMVLFILRQAIAANKEVEFAEYKYFYVPGTLMKRHCGPELSSATASNLQIENVHLNYINQKHIIINYIIFFYVAILLLFRSLHTEEVLILDRYLLLFFAFIIIK